MEIYTSNFCSSKVRKSGGGGGGGVDGRLSPLLTMLRHCMLTTDVDDLMWDEPDKEEGGGGNPFSP